MRDNDKELLDLAAKFSGDENELRTMIEEIRRGDELLRREDQIEVKAVTLAKANARVRAALAGSARRSIRVGRLQRAVAVAAGLIIALGGMAYWLQNDTDVAPEGELGEPDILMVLATGIRDEIDLETNDMFYTEIVHYWAEDNLDVDEILKTDRDGEPESVGIS